MSDPFSADSEAPSCGGCGYFSGPVCCGLVVRGECQITCCVEEQVACGGCADCTEEVGDAANL
jgi:hypothetical protein